MLAACGAMMEGQEPEADNFQVSFAPILKDSNWGLINVPEFWGENLRQGKLQRMNEMARERIVEQRFRGLTGIWGGCDLETEDDALRGNLWRFLPHPFAKCAKEWGTRVEMWGTRICGGVVICLLTVGAFGSRLLRAGCVRSITRWRSMPDIAGKTFTGEETIDVVMGAPARSVTLNAAEIRFGEVSATATGSTGCGADGHGGAGCGDGAGDVYLPIGADGAGLTLHLSLTQGY